MARGGHLGIEAPTLGATPLASASQTARFGGSSPFALDFPEPRSKPAGVAALKRLVARFSQRRGRTA